MSSKGSDIVSNTLSIIFIINGTNLNGAITKKTARETTKIPFTTDIRTWAKSNVETLILSKLNEIRNVALRRFEVKRVIFKLMCIPKDVDCNSVNTHSLGHLKAVLPILIWDTRRVHLTRDHMKLLSVKNHLGAIIREVNA